jgi:hypothetical protein
MYKKILSAFLTFTLILCLAACSGGDPTVEETSTPSVVEPPKPVFFANNLTGIENLTEEQTKLRPIAIMINNINVAQEVQAGVQNADIVYETEVEGGITRLMAVYQDVSKVSQIGSVRSARYPYVDLALGHDAIYVHHGQDPTYCAPHLKDINHISIDQGTAGAKRVSNGLAREHTLYLFGADLWGTLSSKFRSEKSETKNWQNFAEDKNTIALAGGAANKVTVPFTRAYQTEFTFDSTSKTYTRSIKGVVRNDYKTGEAAKVTNLFILDTTIPTILTVITAE